MMFPAAVCLCKQYRKRKFDTNILLFFEQLDLIIRLFGVKDMFLSLEPVLRNWEYVSMFYAKSLNHYLSTSNHRITITDESLTPYIDNHDMVDYVPCGDGLLIYHKNGVNFSIYPFLQENFILQNL